MPLFKIVVKVYALIIEIALWFVLLGSLIGGWKANGFLNRRLSRRVVKLRSREYRYQKFTTAQ